MMPLISFLLPLIVQVPNAPIHHQPSADLTRCLHDLKNTLVVQDYLEAILTYLTGPGTLNKSAVQIWLDTLFKPYRRTLAQYSSSASTVSALDFYLTYFELFADTRRLKWLSWQERKAWVEKEWIYWTPAIDNRASNHMEIWMLTKSDTLLNQEMTDLEVDLLLQKNVIWLSEADEENNMGPASSTIFTFLMGQYSKGKVPNMRLLYGVFGKHCAALVETGLDTTEIVTILEIAHQLILEHLQGPTDVIALLMSLVQIALHHMASLLPYAQWFQTTFVNSSSTILKSKHQYQLWLKHMETMIPYEMTTVLQIHAKALMDSAIYTQASRYITSVKAKLLALGVDAALRYYPSRLDTPLLSDLISPSCGDIGGSISKGKLGGSGNNHIVKYRPAELQKLMDRYGDTETVPQSLWEDSIFRPKWFKQTFLPALMIDWKPTDTLTLTRRAHMIKSFQRKGKVPISLLEQYQQT
ncbi:hypothetical protein BCR42DRAFT_407976 [Absidia repens]|uniref:Uncharacterized protein n=1 Tax=Absidia repens TaxID=90262 RepID=A0A1X2IT05_9FUNG|nr:hypothetical protein BCR42DRAFT_407976 [Absidia repens]